MKQDIDEKIREYGDVRGLSFEEKKKYIKWILIYLLKLKYSNSYKLYDQIKYTGL